MAEPDEIDDDLFADLYAIHTLIRDPYSCFLPLAIIFTDKFTP